MMPLIGYSATKLSTNDYAYFGGSYNGKLGYTKYNLLNGNPSYSYQIQNSNGPSIQQISKLSKFVNTILSSITIFACAENLGSDGFDIGLLKIQETFLGPTLIQSWYLDMDVKSHCLDVKIDLLYSYMLFYKENSIVLQGKITLLDSYAVMLLQQIRLSTTISQTIFPKIGYITEQNQYFFVGQTSQINAFSYIKNSFIFQLGIGIPKINNPSQQTITPSTESIIYKEQLGIISQDIKIVNLQQLPSNCLQLEPQGIILLPSFQSQYNYTVNETELVLNFQDFIYSKICVDQSWTYEAIMANDSPLPNFIRFIQNANGFGSTFKIYSQNNQTQGTYELKLKAILGNMYQSSLNFKVVVKPLIVPIQEQNLTGNTTYLNNTTNNTNSNNSTNPVENSNSTNSSNAGDNNLTTNQTNNNSQTNNTNQNEQNNTSIENQNSTSNQTEVAQSNNQANSSNNNSNNLNQTNLNSTNNTQNTTEDDNNNAGNQTNATAEQQNNDTSIIGVPLIFFETPIQDNFTVSVGSNLTYEFPKLNNALNLSYSLAVSELFLNKTPEMVSYNETHLQIKPQLNDSGKYYLILEIQTQNNSSIDQSEQYMIKLNISKKQNQRGIKPVINLIQNNSALDNQTSNLTDFNLNFEIQSISMHQELLIKFSKEIMISELLANQIQKALEINIANIDQQISLFAIKEWNLIELNKQYLRIKLAFNETKFLASSLDSKILVKIKDPTLIKAADTNLLISVECSADKWIPPQINPYDEDIESIQDASTIISKLLEVIIIGCLLMGILAGSSLQFLWGLINTLQLVTHTPLFTIQYTANIWIFLKILFDIVNLDFYNAELLLQNIFQLKSSDNYESYNDRFAFLGYDNSNFIQLIGSPMLFLLYYVALGFLLLIV
ncbi:UNKNOWN [Stylonychia lemnae]|uniref:Cadg domain containing protein n=1 Tax=Stylonychia lemnae TaxID=5949 RepID=A0A078B5V0_STYLE|nr:UNKNOWN [Stylonychia lemnae]|eukprot:CDW89601.1 UNKNOWN [Stylonychia lemnae]